MPVLRAIRSALGFFLCLAFMGGPALLVLYLWAFPMAALFKSRKKRIAAAYGWFVSAGILASLRIGGARFDMRGTAKTDQPGLVLGNHQSVLDAPVYFQMCRPWLPRVVARARYLKAPVVAGSIGISDALVVDPHRDRLGAVDLLRRAAAENEPHAFAIFPEGHRSRTGEVMPFRTAGCIALLAGRSVPVATIVVDGAWHVSRLTDVVFRLSSVRMRAEVVEEVTSPGNPDDLPAFLEARRQKIIDTLQMWRSER